MKENRITFAKLGKSKDWKEAIVVFSDESLGNKGYTVEERSYTIYSDSKYFNPEMIGSSLFGNCLDGKDLGVRLDHYMQKGWEIEYCYIVK